jgi:hypothetical protein
MLFGDELVEFEIQNHPSMAFIHNYVSKVKQQLVCHCIFFQIKTEREIKSEVI